MAKKGKNKQKVARLRAQLSPDRLERDFATVLAYIRDQGIEPEKPLSHLTILHALQDHHKIQRIGLPLGQSMKIIDYREKPRSMAI